MFKAIRRYLVNLVSVFIFIAVFGGMCAVAVFYFYGGGLPDYKRLAEYEPPVVTRLYSNDGKLFAEYAHEKRVFVPIEAIPKRLTDAFLAAEDKNFYHHYGIDFFGIIRASLQNIKRRSQNIRPVGASTITQQVAKNFLLSDISKELSYERKIKEAILAFRIEQAYSKKHILELYLNEIFLGAGSYGVAAASLNYFDKPLDQLSIAEAAYLAGLPKAPSHYNPSKNYDRALIRRNYVLGRMYEDGFISKDEYSKAKSEPITLHNRADADVVKADYFAEEVRREVLNKFGENSLYEGGLTVRTSMDPRLQQIAVKTLRNGLEEYDRKHGFRGPVAHIDINYDWQTDLSKVKDPAGMRPWKKAVVIEVTPSAANIGFVDGTKGSIPMSELTWARKYITVNSLGPVISKPLDVVKPGDVVLVSPRTGDNAKKSEYRLCQIPVVSGALVALDPYTGRVLAMVGGFSYDISQYNRATQAYRQPGSAFKPLVYTAALEKGVSPSDVFMDAPIAINMGWGLGIWKPKNFEDKFFGPTTMRVAFEKSRNTIAVRLAHEKVGITNIIDVAKRLKVTDNMPKQLAMVLGAGETTLLRMTNAFGAFINDGKLPDPTFIDRIQDRHGKTVWVNESSKLINNSNDQDWVGQSIPQIIDSRQPVIDPRIAYQMVSLMTGVVENGTGRRAKISMSEPKTIAGKTGTTNDFFDAWFVGFSPNLVVGVYIGFDGPKSLGNKQGGGILAAPLFGKFMDEALKGEPDTVFRIPPGIRLVKVNRTSGAVAQKGDKDVIWESFKAEDKVSNYSKNFNEGESTDESAYNQNSQPSNEMSGTGGLY